jgi:hypothetical protein
VDNVAAALSRASGKLTACGRCVANRGATSPRTIA